MILSLFSGNQVRAAGRPVSEFHPVLAVFGGAKLDLRDAVFVEGANNLSVLALFGGVELWVPGDVGVYAEGLSAFGGRDILGQRDGGVLAFGDFESPDYRSAARRLNLTALACFGGVKVHRVPAAAPVPTPPSP